MANARVLRRLAEFAYENLDELEGPGDIPNRAHELFAFVEPIVKRGQASGHTKYLAREFKVPRKWEDLDNKETLKQAQREIQSILEDLATRAAGEGASVSPPIWNPKIKKPPAATGFWMEETEGEGNPLIWEYEGKLRCGITVKDWPSVLNEAVRFYLHDIAVNQLRRCPVCEHAFFIERKARDDKEQYFCSKKCANQGARQLASDTNA